MSVDTSTRDRILGMIAASGPITAATIAHELSLTPAGIRRHLGALTDEGMITEHEVVGHAERGRGRPSRAYVATHEGQQSLTSAYADFALGALTYMRDSGTLPAFVEAKAKELEASFDGVVNPDDSIEERVESLSKELNNRGFAASVRPGPGGMALQLCQGHCPVQDVAEAVPEWCEAEAEVFSHVLDVHVQRLATLAGGAHVCTTNIPLTPVTSMKGTR